MFGPCVSRTLTYVHRALRMDTRWHAPPPRADLSVPVAPQVAPSSAPVLHRSPVHGHILNLGPQRHSQSDLASPQLRVRRSFPGGREKGRNGGYVCLSGQCQQNLGHSSMHAANEGLYRQKQALENGTAGLISRARRSDFCPPICSSLQPVYSCGQESSREAGWGESVLHARSKV